MPIIIFNLPRLIREEVLKHLTFHEIFNLSLCSNSTRRAIQFMRWPILRIQYCIKPTSFLVVLERKCGRDAMIVLTYGSRDWNRGAEEVELASGMRFWFKKNPEIEKITHRLEYEVGKNREDAQLAIHYYVHSLFRFKPETCFILTYSQTFPLSIPNIPGIVDTRFEGDRIPIDFLEEHLSKFPTHRSATVVPKIVSGQFSRNSKIFQLEGLFCMTTSEHTHQLLSEFQGKQLFLFNAICLCPVIRNMVVDWMENKGKYNNLEALLVRLGGNYGLGFSVEFVLYDLDLMPKDPERKPMVFQVPLRIISDFDQVEIDCTNAVDIVRKVDNKRASTRVGATTFGFCVWN